MTPSLHYQILIKHAVTYTKYLAETDPHTLTRYAQFYHTGDIKQWAKERIGNLLAAAGEILKTMSENEITSAQTVARGSLERLALAGRDGTVPIADIVKIKKK